MRKNKSNKQLKKKYYRNGKYYNSFSAYMKERNELRDKILAAAEEAKKVQDEKMKKLEEAAELAKMSIVELAEKVKANGGNRKARRPAILAAKKKAKDAAEAARIAAEEVTKLTQPVATETDVTG